MASMLRTTLTRATPSLLRPASSSSLAAAVSCPSSSSAAVSCPLVRSFATKAPLGGNKGTGNKKGGGKDAKVDASAKKKKKKGPIKAESKGQSGDMSTLEDLLEAQLTQPPAVDPRTPAELALDHEYAKEYSRRLMREERERQRADHNFLRARWTALNALPVSLRNEALKEDMTPWPKHFQPIPWTPQEYVKRFGGSGMQAAADAAAAAPASGSEPTKKQ